MNPLQDLYSDYLLTNFDKTTATGLSDLLNGGIAHDQITRMLFNEQLSSRHLWMSVKPFVQNHASDDAALIFDDTIFSKPYMGENALNCCHWDHSQNQVAKGINLLTAFIIAVRPLKPSLCAFQ